MAQPPLISQQSNGRKAPDASWTPAYALCSSRNPHEARIFKSITGAVNELTRLGFDGCMVVLRKDTQDFNIDVVLHTPPDEIPPPL